jgi:hypothetical protein
VESLFSSFATLIGRVRLFSAIIAVGPSLDSATTSAD